MLFFNKMRTQDHIFYSNFSKFQFREIRMKSVASDEHFIEKKLLTVIFNGNNGQNQKLWLYS